MDCPDWASGLLGITIESSRVSSTSLLRRCKDIALDLRISCASPEIDILDPVACGGGVFARSGIVKSALFNVYDDIAFEPQLAFGAARSTTVKLLVLGIAIDLVSGLPTVGPQTGAQASIGIDELRACHLRLHSTNTNRLDMARVLEEGRYVVVAASRKFDPGAGDMEIE